MFGNLLFVLLKSTFSCSCFHSDSPDRVKFNLTFEGDRNPAYIETDLNDIIYKDLPKIRYDRWLGYKLGDLLIYYQNFTDFTEVPLKFRVLNLTWSDDLMNKNSGRYRLHAELFCQDVSIKEPFIDIATIS